MLIGLGVLSSMLVAWIAYRMDVADREGFPIHLSWKAISYWPWLLLEIIKANILVAQIIIGKKKPRPLLFRTPATQKSELGQVTYANSITLTPGTVSIGVGEGMIDVHSLSVGLADDLKTGVMNSKVCRLEEQGYKLKGEKF